MKWTHFIKTFRRHRNRISLLLLAATFSGLTAAGPSTAHGAEPPEGKITSATATSAPPTASDTPRALLNRLTEDQLHGHIRFLADDLLEGRGPGSNGDRLTQLYLETQFQTFGLDVLPNLGSYRQAFPLVGIQSRSEEQWQFKKNGKPVGSPFQFFKDFISASGKQQSDIAVENAEVIFVGYGIQAPEYQWDDFKGVDVRGKILLVMNNDPESDPSLFAGARRLYYGRWSYKYEMAAKLGAAGVIIIHTDHSAGYPFSVLQASAIGEEFELGDSQAPRLDFKAWMTNDASKSLVQSAGLDLETLRTKAESRDFQPIPLGLTLSTKLTCQINQRQTANVLAYLPGTDPKLKEEYVVLMAHHDHLGIADSRDENGDSIYNGAIDNASGTAALLAMAQAVVQNEEKPSRSLIFAAVGAEEQGLLGSQYFAENSPVPIGKISALINMDALNAIGPTKDIHVIGAGKSSLDLLIEKAAMHQKRIVIPDRDPSKGYYYRSDQFSLAKVGVPGVYLHTGFEVIGKPSDWGKQQLDIWNDKHYHQRSDAYQPNWDLSGAVADMQLLLDVAWQAANAKEMQRWKSGDEFEAARERSIEAQSLPLQNEPQQDLGN